MKHVVAAKFVAFATILTLALFLAPFDGAHAKTAEEIDASVDAALSQFKRDVKGADEYLEAAKGVLVVPEVKKVGFVLGAQWGEGALRIGDETAGYYKMEAGSIGFQAGYQKADFVFIFFTDEVLNQFVNSKGWTAGVDAGITIVEAGAGLSADTLKGRTGVAGFAFGKEGLMGGWSAKGTKITQFTPGE